MLFLVKTLFIMFLSLLFVSGFLKKFGPDGGINSFPISPSQLVLIEMFAIGIPSFFLALQPNYRKIQGKFLFNVIKRSLPGALAVAVEVMFTYILSSKLGLSTMEVITIVVIVATATCMMILYIACKPFSFKKALLFTALSACCLVIIYNSTTGKTWGKLNFQEQFKLYSLVKEDKKPVPHNITELPGDLMEVKDVEKQLYAYTFELPKNVPNDVKVKVLFSNGIINFVYATELDPNNNHFINGEWKQYSEKTVREDDRITIYYTNDQGWKNVYAYLFYETVDEVKDATPLLLAVALSETSYIINFVFNYFINGFSVRKVQNDIVKARSKKEENEELNQ